MEENEQLTSGEQAMRMLETQSTKDEVRAALMPIKRYIHTERNNLKACPFCNAHIEDRIESLYAELLAGLYRVLRWCEENHVHEFNMKDVRHLLGQINYPRFGNLVHYGGVVYPIRDEKGKRMRGKFGINMMRAWEVFANTRPFPVQKKIDMITGETLEETCIFVKDMPALAKFIDAEGVYHPEVFVDASETVPSKRGVPEVTI